MGSLFSSVLVFHHTIHTHTRAPEYSLWAPCRHTMSCRNYGNVAGLSYAWSSLVRSLRSPLLTRANKAGTGPKISSVAVRESTAWAQENTGRVVRAGEALLGVYGTSASTNERTYELPCQTTNHTSEKISFNFDLHVCDGESIELARNYFVRLCPCSRT